jgi:acetyltransferase-like isoleucine patch superfamily enzyme
MTFKQSHNIKVHSTADVQSKNIGPKTMVWQYSIILPNAIIGSNCNINANVFIENDVIIGDDVTIKCGVQIWDGIRIGNNVQVGPNVTFTNDSFPRSKRPFKLKHTVLEEGVSIGGNATICPGLKIERFALIGAGAVVTKNVPAFTIVKGNPARVCGYITREGLPVDMNLKGRNGKNYVWSAKGDLVEG